MGIIRQSTAATVLVGPVLDSSGAEYTSMVIGDLNITKNGTTAAMAAAATLTHSHNGYYLLAMTTGNSDTVGLIEISSNKATYSMGLNRFNVVEEAVYDALFAASSAGYNTVTPLDAAATRSAVGLATANLDTQLADIPTVAEFEARTLVAASYFDPATDTVANVTTVGSVTGSVGSVTGLTASNLDATISSRASGADLAVVAAYLDTEIAAILADTNELQTDWANGGRLDTILDARASQTSVDTVDTVADAIKVVTDQFVFTVANQVDANALTGGGGGSAAAIADAVWDEALSGHLTAGTTGKALSDAGGSSIASDVTAIKAKTDLITSQTANQTATPVNTLTIRRGDSFSGTHAVTTDYTGYTATFTIRHRVTDAVLVTASAAVTNSTTLTVTLTTTNTAFSLLTEATEFGPHPYDIQLVNGATQATVFGIAIIRRDMTRT